MASGETQRGGAELSKSIRRRLKFRSSQQHASFSCHCNAAGRLLFHVDCKEMKEKFLCVCCHVVAFRQLRICAVKGGIKSRGTF